MYKRGSKHSLEERGQAVRQVIDQNQSIQRVAKNYETSRTALKTWVRKYKAEGLDGLKKSRMTFFRYICLILLMLTLALPKIVNANEAFYGHYVPSEASIIKELIIEQNTFQIFLNNYSDTIPSDNNLQRIMDIRNYLKNIDSYTLTVDSSEENINEVSIKPNSQIVAIEFWDGEVFPMFAVNIYNPRYYFADDYLTITFPDRSTWSFKLDVEQNTLEDHQKTTFIRIDEP